MICTKSREAPSLKWIWVRLLPKLFLTSHQPFWIWKQYLVLNRLNLDECLLSNFLISTLNLKKKFMLTFRRRAFCLAKSLSTLDFIASISAWNISRSTFSWSSFSFSKCSLSCSNSSFNFCMSSSCLFLNWDSIWVFNDSLDKGCPTNCSKKRKTTINNFWLLSMTQNFLYREFVPETFQTFYIVCFCAFDEKNLLLDQSMKV